MLIERSQLTIGVIAAVLVLIGTIFAALITGSTMLVRGERITAEFTDAAGLKAGDFVYVSGVRVGQVTDIQQIPQSSDPEFQDQGPVVEAEMALTTDADVPADSRAEVFLSSTLGRRGLMITPVDNSPEHLAEVGALEPGDVITLGRTSTLTDLPEFGDDTTEFLQELDVEALRDLTTALADVTEDQREDVDRLLDGVQSLAQVLVDRREQLGRTLDRAEALVDVAESRDDEIIEVIDNFQVTLDTLLAKQDEVERLLQETASTSTNAADLVSERRAQIDRVVRDLSEALEVVDRHQVDVAHSVPYLSVGLEGFSSIGYLNRQKQDTPAWGNVFVTSLGNVGVEALLGCGGTMDEALTELFGPDPGCDGNVDEEAGTSGDSTDDGETASGSTSALDAIFRGGLAMHGEAQR